jgi:hypothetical protein
MGVIKRGIDLAVHAAEGAGAREIGPVIRGARKARKAVAVPVAEPKAAPSFTVAARAAEKATPSVEKAKRYVRRSMSVGRYRDKPTKTLEDWQWRPLRDVHYDLGQLSAVTPEAVDFGRFMQDMSAKAGKGLDPRDLLKAYTITRSSMQRQAIPLATAEKGGLELGQLGLGMVRPEGAYAEWLGTPAGQAYLDAAQRGQVRTDVLEDLKTKFQPFGFQNSLANDLVYGAENLPQYSGRLSDMISGAAEGDMTGAGNPQEWLDFVRNNVRGVDASKAGFVGAMLGRGDLPTLDARQVILQTGGANAAANKYKARQNNFGAVESVQRLADRIKAMDLEVPEDLRPYYQHLAHHSIWDRAAKETTTHADLMNAMRNYKTGGLAVRKAA